MHSNYAMTQTQLSKKPNDQNDEDEIAYADEDDDDDYVGEVRSNRGASDEGVSGVEGARDDEDDDNEEKDEKIQVLQAKVAEFEEVNRDLKARFDRLSATCSRYQQQYERLQRINGN